MEFVILGSTALIADGRNVDLGTAKQRGLLAVLLYHAGTPVRMETIVEHLWGRRAVDDCRGNLYALASRTRAALRAVGQPDAMVRVPRISAYRLDIERDMVDYHRFRAMVASARDAAGRDRHEDSVGLLSRAISLWRDEPVADLRGPRAEAIRRSMNEAFLAAHKLLAECQLKVGQYEAVLAGLEPVLPSHNLDEALARSWISALDGAGRVDEARAFTIDFRQRFRKVMRVESTIEPVYPRRPDRPAGAHSIRDHKQLSGEGPPPDQLPRDISDFAGRTELLAQLDDLTDNATSGAAVVILGGMPGVGKTTLVTHWAHQQRHRFPDGRLYLNADAYGPTPPVRPAEALGRFLHALGVPSHGVPLGAEQRRERFNQILNNRRVLIVLDNVLNSDQARPLIPTSKNCVTVITSRNRLRGLAIREGVRGVTVAPLAGEESLGLLNQVIGPERAGREPAAARRLAKLSGGLPLALRIIGEHVAERPLARIVDLVDELSLHMLDCEGEDDEDATLRNVFAWSYNALDPRAARLFRLLGLYPGRSISAVVAGVLLGTDKAEGQRFLDSLARAHLVNHDTAARYRCHDLIRLYAEDRLGHEESFDFRHTTLRRLFDWYLLSAANAAALLAPHQEPVPDLPPAAGIEPLVFASDTEAMAWCESERANLRAVVRAAADHGFHRHAWQLPGALHEAYQRYGRQNDVIEIHHIALAASEVDGHEVGQIGTHNNLGATFFAIHDYDLAADHFAAALDLARRISYVAAEAACAHNLAAVRRKAGDAATAIDIYQEVLRICRDVSDLPGQASTLDGLGIAYRQLGRLDTSASYHREALDIWERIGSLRDQACTHTQLAALYLDGGQPQESLRECALALDINSHVKDEANRCDTLTTAADARRTIGLYARSAQDARSAILIAEDIADAQRQSRALAVLAETLLDGGDRSGARHQSSLALGIAGDDPESRPTRDRLLAVQRALDPPSATA